MKECAWATGKTRLLLAVSPVSPKTAQQAQDLSAYGLAKARIVGTIANVQAELITRFKDITPEGGVIESVAWRVPQPVPPTAHGFKYRAVYALGGVRVVGFDNERGKGDHCHVDGREQPHVFTTVEQLVEDFIAAVAAARTAACPTEP